MTDMNAVGAERLIRTLAAIQGPLEVLAGSLGSSRSAARAYERAKGYFTLITLPADEVVRLATDRPLRYSVAEWEALLSVRVPGRPVGPGAAAALRRALDPVYNLSAGRRVAAALDEIGGRVQAPVATLADSITAGFKAGTAGLKGGVLQARALLKQAAEATSAAVAEGASRARGGAAESSSRQQ
jgi:hypothetical protein